MSFGRIHKIVAYIIAGLGLLSLGLGSELADTTQLALALAFVASFFAEGPILRDKRWIHGWTIAMIAFFVIQIARGFWGASILPLALELTAALQITRLFNRRSAREHQQIAALSLLHLILATVLSTDLSYAFAFLGFVVVLPWMLALSHLRLEIEGQLGVERERSLARVLASRRLIGAGFLAGTAGLALPLFAMTGVLFVAFPRVGLGFLSFSRDPGQRMTGFGSDIELGEFGVLRSDPTVVMRVRPPELGAAAPRQAAIRMRGTSYDHYDGRRWTRSDRRAENLGRVGSYYAVPVRLPSPSRDRPWDVVLDPLEEPVIFFPPNSVGLEVSPRVRGGLEVGREISYVGDVEVRYGDRDGLGLRYRAWVSSEERPYAPLPAEEARRYLQLPDGHERVARLARRWTAGARDEEERAERVLVQLRDSARYRYSLEMPRVGRRAPLDVFLFEARSGHCEYFATAMVIMLRSVGIPARNVTGFLGGRYNSYGRYYALSQGDAHSWVEAWLPERGWVTFDPTPPLRSAIAPDDGLLTDVREMLDALRTRWSEDVVAYDLRAQVRLFRRMRDWLGSEGAASTPATDHVPRARIGDAPAWPWLFVLGLAIAAGLGWFVWRRRGTRTRAHVDAAVREAIDLYLALDRALERLGHARPPARTPLEHVAHLEAARFAALPIVREVTERYLSARFGGARLPPEDLERLTKEVRALRGRGELAAPSR